MKNSILLGVAGLGLLILSSPLSYGDPPLDGNALHDFQALDLYINGDTLTLGTAGSSFGLELSYTDSLLGTSQITLAASRLDSEWLFGRVNTLDPATTDPVMRIDVGNALRLYSTANPTDPVIVIDPDPVAPGITIGGIPVLMATTTLIVGDSTATGDAATAMGHSTASGGSATALGSSNASGSEATAIGSSTATGEGATAVGTYSYATGSSATAFGSGDADGDHSTAFGNSYAVGNSSTAMGTASLTGNASIASGYSYVDGDCSTAMGAGTVLNDYATAFGNGVALGYASTAMGWQTQATSLAQVVVGQYNIPQTAGDPTNWVLTDELFTVGNGADSSNQSNALVILKSGDATFKGVVHVAKGGDIPMFDEAP